VSKKTSDVDSMPSACVD